MEEYNTTSNNDKNKIVITKRQASIVTASMLLLCLSVFIIGYFLGKRSVLEDFSGKITETSLNDQIDYLLTSQASESSSSDSSHEDDVSPNSTDLSSIDQDLQNFAEDDSPEKNIAKSEKTASSHPTKNENQKVEAQSSSEDDKLYYARLVGFGSKKTALAFVDRLKKHGIEVIIKTRVSMTAKGKRRTWYQAVTPTMSDEQELNNLVEKIKRIEHIRDAIKTIQIQQK